MDKRLHWLQCMLVGYFASCGPCSALPDSDLIPFEQVKEKNARLPSPKTKRKKERSFWDRIFAPVKVTK